MTSPTFSPDGQWMWNGSEWIPAPPTSNAVTQLSDTVVMGNVNTNTNYTTILNSQTNIRNHMNAMVDALSVDDEDRATYIFDTAKKEDYNLAMQLFNGEFHDKIVMGKYNGAKYFYNKNLKGNELKSYNHTAENIMIWNPVVERMRKKLDLILEIDSNHIPTLILFGDFATAWDGLKASGGIEMSRQMYGKVLQIRPDLQAVKHKLASAEAKHNETIQLLILMGLSFVALFFIIIMAL